MRYLEKIKGKAIYLGVLAIFSLVSLSYFYPILRGEQIVQSDIQQFKGMAKQVMDYRAEKGTPVYWLDSAFCGMPTYQVMGGYRNDLVRYIDGLIRFLPRPADYLFLYFLGFFVLLSVLKVNWKLALVGSLAFGFSTYFIVILGVGHNSKAHAIGYIPMVIAGVCLLLRQQYFWGFMLTTLAATLQLYANHLQMSYYLAFALLLLVGFWAVAQIKNKAYKKMVLTFGFLCLSGILAIGSNANRILPTQQYGEYSTRGKSTLTITPKGTQKDEVRSGLSKSYITAYSYGILETLNLCLPRFMGGGSSEHLGRDSETYSFLASRIGARQAAGFVQNTPTYWGEQPFVAAPAYLGIVLVFCFVLGLWLIKDRLQRWGLATIIFALLLSWGKNFPMLTDFFINYVPLYNKFRAVSSIQILIEVLVPLLGIRAVHFFISEDIALEKRLKALKKTAVIFIGGLCFLWLFGGGLFAFSSEKDAYFDQMIKGFSQALIADRKAIFQRDIVKALFLIGGVVVLFWAFLKAKIGKSVLVLLFGVLLLIDLLPVDWKYVNEANFKKTNALNFKPTAIDKQLLKDTTHYRVFNMDGDFMNDGLTSYYHKSIGGYHAAKLGRYQELVNFYLSTNVNPRILNMLNTKYLIVKDKQGQQSLRVNTQANGNAWFVNQVKVVANDDEAMLSLGKMDNKQTAVVLKEDWQRISKDLTVSKKGDFEVLSNMNTGAFISLKNYQIDKLVYKTQTHQVGLAVFSEIFYKEGWQAYIDGKPVPIVRANYLLRALPIPKGTHEVVFEFKPKVVQVGGVISLCSYGVFVLLLLGFGFFQIKKRGYLS